VLILLPKEVIKHDPHNAKGVDNSLDRSRVDAQARGTPKLGALAHSALMKLALTHTVKYQLNILWLSRPLKVAFRIQAAFHTIYEMLTPNTRFSTKS
jgi:hypothetical protein